MEKIARGELWRAKAPLDRFFESKIDGIPASIGFKLAQLSRKVDKEHAILEKERLRLIRVYGEKGDNGIIAVPVEQQQAFYEEFLPLTNEEVDSPIDQKIVLPDVMMPLDVLKDLEPFIEVQEA